TRPHWSAFDPPHFIHCLVMKASEILGTLEKIEHFRSEVQRPNKRVDDLGPYLEEAVKLLAPELSGYVGGSDGFGTPRIVLDWVTAVIVKLAGGLKLSVGAKPDHERHVRNARRWLLDHRLWEVFTGALEATIDSNPSTSIPQSTGLALLQAAVFTAHNAQPDEGGVTAAEWVALAIGAMCGLPCSRSPMFGERKAAPGLNPRKGVAGKGSVAPLRVSLDVFVTFLAEAMRGHVRMMLARGRASQGSGIAGFKQSSAEEAMVLLLRFHRALQRQQTNQRKVFSTCCTKLMGPLLQIIVSPHQQLPFPAGQEDAPTPSQPRATAAS
ncbi:unnamed protein product, partial [Discosporangium mesarthrocarpum]